MVSIFSSKYFLLHLQFSIKPNTTGCLSYFCLCPLLQWIFEVEMELSACFCFLWTRLLCLKMHKINELVFKLFFPFKNCKYRYGWKKSTSFCFPFLPFSFQWSLTFVDGADIREGSAVIASSRKDCPHVHFLQRVLALCIWWSWR